MLKSVRSLLGLSLFVAVATAAFAQSHPMPGHKNEPPVLCTGCLGSNPSGQLNDGLPTYPYGGVLIKHVGRYVDSSRTQSFQHWSGGFRTARARTIRTAPTQRKNAPPRVYIQIGNAMAAYSLDTFFTSLTGGMKSITYRFGGAGQNPDGTSREKYLDWDGFVYAELEGSGWQTTGGDFQDPMSKAVPFDFDDRGLVYVAYENFGWGISIDDGGTSGGHFKKVSQLIGGTPAKGFTNVFKNGSGVKAEAIIAIKDGGKYYVVTADRNSNMAIFDVTNEAAPTLVRKIEGQRNVAIRAMARDDNTRRIAFIDNNFDLRIFDYSALIAGGAPIAEFQSGSGKFAEVVSMDESGNVWAAEKTGLIWKLVPSGNTYVKHTYRPYTSNFEAIMLHAAAGYLAVGGIDWTAGTADVKVLRIEANGPTIVNTDNFFRNYYHTPPPGYATPYSYTSIQAQSADVEIIKWGGKTYLLYSGFGLGDVFELEGGNSINVTVKGAPYGTPNPNAKSTEPGPYYGDPVTFIANSSSPNVNYDVTWNFGNPEATSNTGRSRTGEEETHQYTGIATAAAIVAPKAVKAQAIQDPNVGTQYNLSLRLPTARVGVSSSSTPISASVNGFDVVAGDTFNDASDGSVEGHYSIWNVDGAVTNMKPDQSISTGDVGTHTLTFRAAYGSYDTSWNISNPYVTPALTVGYVVRPYKVTINAPTADATNVTFTATPRITQNANILSATTWDVVWTVNGTPQNSGVSTSAVGLPIGQIPPLVLPRTGVADGTVIGLKINVDPTKLVGAAAPYAEYVTSTTLSTPDPQITVTGCANAMSPCKFTASSASSKSMADWAFLWTLSRPSGTPLTGTGATFEPALTAAGNYTITLRATKSIFPVEVSKQLTVGPSLCGPLPLSHNVGINKIGCSSGCAPGTNIEFAPTFQGYAKQACDTFSWNLGDGTTKSGEVVNHSYASPGTYSVTLTIANSGTATPLVKTTTVTITGGTTEPPPVGNTCTAPSGITVHYSCNGGTNCRTTDAVSFVARRNGSSLQTCDNVSWTFGDGTGSSAKTPTKTYSAAGTYTVTATVTNTAGSAPAATTQVTITDPVSGNCGVAPSVGNFVIEYVGPTTNCRQFNGTPCNAGENIAFTAPNYYYVVGSCDNFEWDFGDGTPKVHTRDTTHAFAAGQTYTVKLRVYNNAGSYTYNRNVTVAGTTPTRPIPVITATTFPNTAVKGRTVTFTATSNLATTTGWTWNFGDGTAADTSQAGNVSSSSTITHTFASKGIYTVRVSARNSEDAATAPSGEAQGTINVTDAPAIPEYRFLLPVTAYTAGQGGSAWRTDVQVYNSDPQVSGTKPLIMDATFKGITKTLTMIKATHIYENFLGNLLDLQKEDSGPVIITTKSVTAPPQIWTRTYTQTANGTFGQFIPAIRIDNLGGGGAVDPTIYYMSGLRHDARYRTNVGFLNPNATPIQVTVTVYDSAKFKIGEFPLTLQPFQLDQFQLKSKVSNLPDDEPFSVKIDAPAGNWVVAYASFIDGLSNDPVYIQALPESDVASADFKTTIVPGIGHTGQWRSDVTIFNPDADGMMFDLTYYNAAGEKKGEALSVPLDSGKFLEYSDILKQGVLGNVDDGLGTLKVTVKDNHEKYPMTFARTYFDNGPSGTFGQGIPAFSAARANVKPNKPAIIAGVRNTTDYYTNIGMVNVGASNVTVTVTLLDPTTGAAVNAIQYTVKPGQTVLGEYNGWGSITQGTFRIEANGNVWAFSSVVDRRTKDPEYVPALPMP